MRQVVEDCFTDQALTEGNGKKRDREKRVPQEEPATVHHDGPQGATGLKWALRPHAVSSSRPVRNRCEKWDRWSAASATRPPYSTTRPSARIMMEPARCTVPRRWA